MDDERIKLIRNEMVKNTGIRTMILKDKETGVLYLFVSSGGGGTGLTPLIDQNGKPLVDKT
jgi:hypothetical protein